MSLQLLAQCIEKNAIFSALHPRPDFPGRFDNQDHARDHSAAFVEWYNNEHRHSGIALLTPAQLHYGQAEVVLDARQKVLDEAYERHPERFVGGRPQVPALPREVWINPPAGLEGQTSVNRADQVSQNY